MKKTVLKKWIIVSIIVAILFGVYYWYISASIGRTDEPQHKMARVERGLLIKTVSADARVEPDLVVQVKSKANGEIIQLVYEEGAKVKKGDLLVELNPADEKRNVQKMESGLAAAQAKLAKADSELVTASQTIPTIIDESKARVLSAEVVMADANNKLKRFRELNRQKMVSPEEMENSETNYKKAAAEHQLAVAVLNNAKASLYTLDERRCSCALATAEEMNARISLEEAQERLADTRIKATIDGVIISQLVEQGQIISSGISNVSGGTPLLYIADMSRIFVVASVDETDIGQVRTGQEALLMADAYLDKEFHGKVVHISPQGVMESNVVTFSVKIEVEGEEKSLLRPAMSVNVEIITRRLEDVLMIASTAVKRDNQSGKTVFQMVGGKPVAVHVETGFSNGAYTEIIDGLHKGAEVISNVAVLSKRRSKQGPRQKKRSISPFGANPHTRSPK